jgi:hypothetical protein
MAKIKVSNGTETLQVDEKNLDRAKADGFEPLIKVSNGAEFYDVHSSKLNRALADGFKPINLKEEPSNPMIGDVAKKFAQGSGFGLLPRLAGGLEAGGRAIGLKGLGSPDLTNIELQRPELFDKGALEKNYETGKTGYEEALRQASERSPISSGLAEFAGGMMAPIPGAGPATLAGRMAKGAGLGAIQGYGYSENDEEKLKKMATGALLGGAAPAVIEKGIIPAAQKIGEKVVKPIGSFVREKAMKLGETLSGIPRTAIETFEKNPDEIQKMWQSAEGNIPEMADQVKKKVNTAIFTKKDQLNKQLEQSLQNSSDEIDINPIKAALINAKTHLDPKVKTDVKQINQIDAMIDEIAAASENGSTIPIQTANRFKSSLQEQASQSYQKPGEIYSLGSDAARAAKKGAAQIRSQMNTKLPALKSANEVHAKLHDLEDLMHSNLLAEGKPEASLLAAGSGSNQRNSNNLKALGDLVDFDILGEAQKLSAARYFGDPKWTPEGLQTGLTVARQGVGKQVGGIIGAAAGGFLGANPVSIGTGYLVGKEAGGLMSSPAMIANAIKLKRAIPNIDPRLLESLQSGAVRGLIRNQVEK